ncbi:hypothetical protein C8R45DRAFT_840924, partial [Mycena sanguinolenta]
LAQSGSEPYLGGGGGDQSTGSIEPHAVNQKLTKRLGNSAVVSGFRTVIDSGTTIIYALVRPRTLRRHYGLKLR